MFLRTKMFKSNFKGILQIFSFIPLKLKKGGAGAVQIKII